MRDELSQFSQEGSNAPISGASAQTVGRDAVREDLQGLTDRILKLEIEAVQPPKSNRGSDLVSPLVTAIIAGFAGLIAALIGGGMTLLGQRITAKRERERAIDAARQQMELAREAAKHQLELARKQALFQQTEKILEFRLKQMELFYAPMFALLEQSKALYIKMYNQLGQDEPQRYKLLSQPDSEGSRVHVLAKDGTWKGFRLLDQLPAVRTNPKALALVERILAIGKLMTKIISEHAGLASADLIDLLGEYLAHYAILSTIYKRGETAAYEPGWHKMGYYPRQLNAKIEEGYRELSRFLDDYSKASKELLAALPRADSATLADS